jgi:hypothetical protein
VLVPLGEAERGQELREWDLWGPLLLCLLFSGTVALRTQESLEQVFSTVFVLIWVGAVVVTANARLLGTRLSYFSAVCTLGYCVFPINLAVLGNLALGRFMGSPGKLLLVGLGFCWASYSSSGFLGSVVPPEQRRLVLFPVLLFYAYLSWVAIIL